MQVHAWSYLPRLLHLLSLDLLSLPYLPSFCLGSFGTYLVYLHRCMPMAIHGCRKQILIGQAKSVCTMIWLDLYIAMYQPSGDSNLMQAPWKLGICHGSHTYKLNLLAILLRSKASSVVFVKLISYVCNNTVQFNLACLMVQVPELQ